MGGVLWRLSCISAVFICLASQLGYILGWWDDGQQLQVIPAQLSLRKREGFSSPLVSVAALDGASLDRLGSCAQAQSPIPTSGSGARTVGPMETMWAKSQGQRFLRGRVKCWCHSEGKWVWGREKKSPFKLLNEVKLDDVEDLWGFELSMFLILCGNQK